MPGGGTLEGKHGNSRNGRRSDNGRKSRDTQVVEDMNYGIDSRREGPTRVILTAAPVR